MVLYICHESPGMISQIRGGDRSDLTSQLLYYCSGTAKGVSGDIALFRWEITLSELSSFYSPQSQTRLIIFTTTGE